MFKADFIVTEDIPVGEDVGSSSCSSDETIHIYKDTGTGGNICAKIVFFLLLGALAVMVGLIVTEYRGSSDGKYSFSMSNFSIFIYLGANWEQLIINTISLAIYFFYYWWGGTESLGICSSP
jgi:hypothetical protein